RDLALKEYGHVDVWVNNAGRGITRPVMNLTDGDLDEIIAVVLKSVVYGMQAIIPHFKLVERGISSTSHYSSGGFHSCVIDLYPARSRPWLTVCRQPMC